MNDLRHPVPATPVLLAIDVSGSMYHLADDVRGGINQYLADIGAEMATDPTTVYTVTMVLFNTTVETVAVDAAPIVVERLDGSNYQPSGGTALLDAVGNLITSHQHVEGERPLVVVFTDGYENSSREWTRANLKALIDERTRQGWGFVYMASTPDTWEGESLGMHSGLTVNTGAGMRGSYSGLAGATVAYAAGASGQTVKEIITNTSRAADQGTHVLWKRAPRATTPEEDNQHGE